MIKKKRREGSEEKDKNEKAKQKRRKGIREKKKDEEKERNTVEEKQARRHRNRHIGKHTG